MTKLENYFEDGACYQAKAVLAFLQAAPNIEESWNKEHQEYDAVIKVARWENCKEQGYIVSLRSKQFVLPTKQLNIAFFEHRNSDSICAVKWEQHSLNTLTIDTADFKGKVYIDKYDVSYEVGYGEVVKMSEWIMETLKTFWIVNTVEKETQIC